MNDWYQAICSQVRVLGALLDEAKAITIYDFEAHIAVFTPARSPWVLHNPVLGAPRFSPAEDQCCMVGLIRGTGGVGLDATRVVTEGGSCLHTNTQRLHSKGGFHRSNVFRCDGGSSFCLDTCVRDRGVPTISICVDVGIVWLEYSCVSQPEIERSLIATSIASFSVLDTVD